MNVIEYIKEKLMTANQEYIENSSDHYNFWEQHIKLVVKEALILAKEYEADKEIVELGMLLHDIALVLNVGSRQEHHINGKIIADELLTQFGYPSDRNCIE